MNPQPSTLNPQPVRGRQSLLPVLPPAFRPMSTLEAARRDITAAGFDYTDGDLQADIDEGRFEWVWNIAAENSVRRELRIFTPCLQNHLHWLNNPKTVRRSYTFAEILGALFPTRGVKLHVSTPDLRRAFVCSGELIIDLIECGALLQVSGTTYRRGNGGAAFITWDSIQNFLQHRRQ
jgi:hypothetical protein